MKRLKLLFLLGTGMLTANSGNELPAAAQSDPRSAETSAVVSANNDFGLRVYQELSRNGRNKNALISPTSIALALEMAYNGAGGTTRTAMAHALQLDNVAVNTLNAQNKILLAGLTNGAHGVRMTVANSLWIANSDGVNPDFLAANLAFYQAAIGDLAGAPDNVNAWVSRKTKRKITSILGLADVERDTRAILANAVYFKGGWTHPFEQTATVDKPFTLLSGRSTPCRMMSQTGSLTYLKGDHFEAVRLPYGDRTTEMVLFLPDLHSNFFDFQAQLTAANWNSWMKGFADVDGTIDVPRFQFEYDADLEPALNTLGMGIAFGPRADFSNLRPAPLWLSRVKHKAFIKVDEEGTEAAAASGVQAADGALNPSKVQLRVRFDRPFLYAIRDTESGAILFLGTVVDPIVK